MINTARLIIKPITPDDYEHLTKLHSDPDVMAHIGQGQPMTADQCFNHCCALLGHWQMRGIGAFTLFERFTGEFVGRCGFLYREEWDSLEIGTVIAKKHWAKGYAGEATRDIVRYGFDKTGRDHFTAGVKPENNRSARYFEKLGWG